MIGQTVIGRVVEEQKNYFLLDTEQGVVLATRKGTLKKENTRVSVGDLVDVHINDPQEKKGIITAIKPRRNLLPRPALANMDQILFVNAYYEPLLDLGTVDKFLFSASVYGFAVHLVFNKSDLLDEEGSAELLEIEQLYCGLGYTCSRTSIHDEVSIAALRGQCAAKVSSFAGVSGVGKSALINLLVPDLNQPTNELSRYFNKGVHTTTAASLHAIPQGGYIADTPGFALLTMPRIDEREVVAHFPEFSAALGHCRFNNCVHQNEPGCAVLEAVEAGVIARTRLEHFHLIRKELTGLRKEYR